uniref:Uncharacterized protein n=1 Tax=Gallus gallus TaxID=9031 RepID=A0A8V0XYD1_CHICK
MTSTVPSNPTILQFYDLYSPFQPNHSTLPPLVSGPIGGKLKGKKSRPVSACKSFTVCLAYGGASRAGVSLELRCLEKTLESLCKVLRSFLCYSFPCLGAT